jgi:methionyl-tRNA formyltransferase
MATEGIGGMRRRLRIALAAEDGAGVQVLRRLVAAGHHVTAVLTDGRTRAAGATVADAARHLDLPLRPAEEVREAALAGSLRRQGIDLLLNVHSLYIVHPQVLRAPTLGAFNLHPGPLPRYAGLNVPCWALYNGEETHGVTLHRMAPDVDAGAIAYADEFHIGPRDTGLTVMSACAQKGLALIDRLVAAAAAGAEIPAVEQDLSRRRWFDAAPPRDGWIDWTGPAGRVIGLVRACDWGPFPSPWGRARTSFEGGEIGVARALRTGLSATSAPGTVRATDGGAVLVAAGDEWVHVERITVRGARREPATLLRPGDLLHNPEGLATAGVTA